MPRLTFSSVSGTPIVVATERADRPNSLFVDYPVERCPFCPGNEEETPPEIERVASATGWDIRVVPNRYPIVGPEGDAVHGRHEVIIDTAHHNETIYDFDRTRLERLLRVALGRMEAATQDVQSRYVVLFKNSGRQAGETLSHPHTQLVALDRDPHSARRLSECRLCSDVRDAELSLAATDRLALFAPSGSRLPYELAIAPQAAMALPVDDELSALATLLHHALRSIASHLRRPAMNWTLDWSRDAKHPHWCLSLLPRLTQVAGFELATGMFVNVIEPQRVARELRTREQA